jgi:hypothetical protein
LKDEAEVKELIERTVPRMIDSMRRRR